MNLTPKNTSWNELNVLSQYRHPNLIKMIDFYLNNEYDELSVVLEYAEETLYDVIQKSPNLERRRKIASELIAALSFLHENYIMHRDVKPGNIMFIGDILKLIDFGGCTRFDTLKKQEVVITTIEYRTPELLLHGSDVPFAATNYGPEVDVWAVGVVLLELEVGSYPFNSDLLLKSITSLLPVPDYGVWSLFPKNKENVLDQVKDSLSLEANYQDGYLSIRQRGSSKS